MPPERNFFGQPQKLSHTTESPLEQAALIENSADLRSKSAVFTNYDGRSRPQFLQLVSSKITMAHECVILADCPGALVELCGISTLERLLRTLQRCGIERATILSSTSERIAEELARPSWPRAQLALALRTRPNGALRIEQIRRHLAGRRSASSRHPRRCRLRQSLIAVARDTKIGRSPGRFGCAVETSTAGGSGPRRIGREGLRCGTVATRLGFDPEWSSRKRD